MAYDLIVIGGGPAGYVAAIRAAQLGKKVACVEADRAGGTCLNWGCIPTKALLKNAELYHTLAHRAKEFGFSFDNLSYDWSAVVGRSRKVSDKLAGGIEFLFKKNKVDYIRGSASLLDLGDMANFFGSARAPVAIGRGGEIGDQEGQIVIVAERFCELFELCAVRAENARRRTLEQA